MRTPRLGEGRQYGPVRVLFAALLFAALFIPSTRSGAQNSRMIPLYSWWSTQNQDHLCTSDPAWAGSTGKHKGAYRFYRREGYLYAPEGPQPPGTMPLYRWRSPSRNDHFTTSNPAWAGVPGESKSGYQFVRLEGYLLDGAGSGRLPLKSYWSASRTDNVATADSAWQNEPRRGPDYRQFRVEGYLLARPEAPPARFPQAPTAPIAEKPTREPTGNRSPPTITSFEVTPTTAGVAGAGGDWIGLSWQTEGADRVRLYEDGREIEGRSQLPSGEFGWPLSMRGFKTQIDRPARYQLVAENSVGKVSETVDVGSAGSGSAGEGSCRVIVAITGKYGQFTDAVGVFQAAAGGLGEFLFKSPVSTVRDHRESQDPTPYQKSTVTLSPGEYVLVPSGGGEDKYGYFGVIYEPGRSGFTCRDGNPGRVSVKADHAEY